MPDNLKFQEWCERIEHLCALIVKRPELTWLWEIRIKVLMYLIRRYGDEESGDDEARAAEARSRGPQLDRRQMRRRQACTADRRTQIRTLLQNIHRVNTTSKARAAS